eukprot:jgi/Ulvmu1/10546/UM064_0084.1
MHTFNNRCCSFQQLVNVGAGLRHSAYRRRKPHCRLTSANSRSERAPIPPQTSAIGSGRVAGKEFVLMYATLPSDIIAPGNSLVYPKALKAALQALKSIGMDGVVVEIWWGHVEGSAPHEYNWSTYDVIFKMLSNLGLRGQVHLCFHGNGQVSLPAWVLEVGTDNPDIFFADQLHDHSLDCLSIGVDEVPLLKGRTALDCYFDFMNSFHHRFEHLYADKGGVIHELTIGMGPQGELRYPAFRSEKWMFPGIGEFQCYDGYMLSALQAAALDIGQPEYGAWGPHDAGTYCLWPSQTKFFRDNGSWSSDYGQFFLSWYSTALLDHADAMLEVASKLFGSSPLKLQVKLPAVYWWHHTQSHAAELTAGINHTSLQEGYLPIFDVLARWKCDVLMGACEQPTSQQPSNASCDSEALVSHVHTCASVVGIQVGLETTEARFDEAALTRIGNALTEDSKRAMQLKPVKSFCFNRMSECMFDPNNWRRYKAFTRRLAERLQKS